MRYPYKPKHYVVEVHIGVDVLHKDYGKDELCALRAVERLLSKLSHQGIHEVRVWHDGSLCSKYEAKQ
jgi:hypothetical protein